MEKRKLLLKDGTAIILEAGSCLGQMEAAYEGREALMTDWEKMTKENLSRVQIKNGDTVTGTYEHLILGDPVLVVRGKEDGTLGDPGADGTRKAGGPSRGGGGNHGCAYYGCTDRR